MGMQRFQMKLSLTKNVFVGYSFDFTLSIDNKNGTSNVWGKSQRFGEDDFTAVKTLRWIGGKNHNPLLTVEEQKKSYCKKAMDKTLQLFFSKKSGGRKMKEIFKEFFKNSFSPTRKQWKHNAY